MKVKFKDLQSSDIAVGVCGAVAFMALSAVIGDLVFGGLIGTFLGCSLALCRRKYIDELQLRAGDADAEEWVVELNGISVGRISDADYATIRLSVFNNTRLYVAQLANCGRVLLEVLGMMLLVVPVCAFWIILAILIVSPNVGADLVDQLREATPANVVMVASYWAVTMMNFGLAVAMFMAIFSGGQVRFGFVNRFGEVTAKIIRQRLRIAPEGKLVLVRWVKGARHASAGAQS